MTVIQDTRLTLWKMTRVMISAKLHSKLNDDPDEDCDEAGTTDTGHDLHSNRQIIRAKKLMASRKIGPVWKLKR